MIGSVIDHMIGDRDHDRSADAAPVSDETPLPGDAEGSQGLSGILRKTEVAAPQPPAQGGGLSSPAGRSIWRSAPSARNNQDVLLETESARLLRDIGIKSPALIEQLAQIPTDIVQAAIATARSRPSTRDLGAVVGRMLRDFRDQGTPIPDPVRPANSGATAAEIRESFRRLGYTLSDDSQSDLNLTEDDVVSGCDGAMSEEPLFKPNPLTRLWNRMLAALQTQIPRAEFNAWFCHMSLLSVESGVAMIMAPNAMTKDVIERRYLGTLRDLLQMSTGETLKVQVLLDPGAPAHGSETVAAAAPGMDAR